jgi:hypothetical protein
VRILVGRRPNWARSNRTRSVFGQGTVNRSKKQTKSDPVTICVGDELSEVARDDMESTLI